MYFFRIQKNTLLLTTLIFSVFFVLISFAFTAQAASTPYINYQGKLTNDSGATVADGTYNMRFWLLTTPSIATTSAVWSESLTSTNKVQVTNGLFSIMLGSTSALTSVNFNQTLYLGVEIGGTGSPSWDGEMSPRKIIGSVPTSFDSRKLGGVASTSFVRSDEADTIAASTASTLLTITQSGVGNILDLYDGVTKVFTVLDGGLVGIGTTTPAQELTVAGDLRLTGRIYDSLDSAGTSGYILKSTGTGQTWVSTTTLGLFAQSAIDSCSEFAAIMAGETGTCGSVVLSADPTFTGTVNAAALTLSSTLTLSGTSANIALGSNYLSGDGQDEGIFVDGSGKVGIGTSTPANKLDIYGGALHVDNTGLVQIGTDNGSAIEIKGSGASYIDFSDSRADDLDFRILQLGSLLSINSASVSNIFNVTGTGNIGIGSSSPSALLSLKTDSYSGNAFVIGSSTEIQMSINANGNAYLGAGALYIDAFQGLVGIGTTTPFTTLDEELVISNDWTGSSDTLIGLSKGATKYKLGIEGNNNFVIENLAESTVYLSIVGTTGNVGIGTTTPSQMLSVGATTGSQFLVTSLGAVTDGSWTADVIASAYLDTATILSTEIDTSSELAGILTDETGTNRLVFSGSPAFSGTATFAGLTATGTATLTTVDINGGAIDGSTIGAASPSTIIGTTIQANTGFLPDTDGGAYLGQATQAFSGLFLDTGATINFDNSNAVLTHSSGILTVSTGDLRVTTAGTNSASVVTVGGTQTLTSKTLTAPTLTSPVVTGGISITGTATTTGNILPGANDTYDLGSTALRFKDLYLGGETLHLGTSLTDEATFGYTTSSNILSIDTDSTSNGDIAFFTNHLYLDKSAGRVGVGTTSPQKDLHVYDPAAATVLIEGDTTSASRAAILQLDSASDYRGRGVLYTATGVNDWYAGIPYTGSGYTIGYHATQAEYKANSFFFIGNTGKIGISTSSPSQMLSVGATTGSQFLVTSLGAVTDGSWTADVIASAYLDTATILSTEIDTSSELAGILTDETGTNRLVFSGSPAFSGTATFAGLTATGTATFSTGISITGTATTTGNILPGANDTYDLGSTALRFKDIYLGGETLHLGTSLTDEATFGYTTSSNILNIGTDSTSNGDIAFFTDDLYLDKSTGNVGIGTTTPSTMLTVGATTNSQFKVTSAGAITDGTWNADVLGITYGGLGAAFTDPNADQLMFWDDSAAKITGISTITGGSISGTTLTINDVTCTDCLTSTEIGDEYLFNSGDTGTGAYTFNDNDGTDNETQLTIGDSDDLDNLIAWGSIGIGTSTPSRKLTINGANEGIALQESSDGKIWTLRNSPTSNGFAIQEDTSGTFRLFVAEGGDIGIGTTSPLAKLDVVETATDASRGIQLTQYSGDTSSGHISIRKARGSLSSPSAVLSADVLSNISSRGYDSAGFGDGSYIRTLATQNWSSSAHGSSLVFSVTLNSATTPSERMRIDQSGNVGIGTTSPNAQLQVFGSGSGTAAATSGNTDSTMNTRTCRGGVCTDFGIINDGTAYMQNRAYNNFATNYDLMINPNGGNVMIGGTTNGGALLTVNGTLSITLATAGTTNNAVCWDNAGVSQLYDCDSTPADYAESYPTANNVTFGHIVMATEQQITQTDGEKVPMLTKAKQGEGAILGITSNNFHDFTSAGLDLIPSQYHPLPVALNGRVPVKINLEGGPIAVGDPITLSSVAGVGTKATSSGQVVVGIALAPYTSVTASGTVLVFVQNDRFLAEVDKERTQLFTTALASNSDDIFDLLLEDETDTIWRRLTTLAEGFVDGVLEVAGLHTDELCVGNTCVNEATLIQVMQLLDDQEDEDVVVPDSNPDNDETEDDNTGTTTEDVSPEEVPPDDESGDTTEETPPEDESEGVEDPGTEPPPPTEDTGSEPSE